VITVCTPWKDNVYLRFPHLSIVDLTAYLSTVFSCVSAFCMDPEWETIGAAVVLLSKKSVRKDRSLWTKRTVSSFFI